MLVDSDSDSDSELEPLPDSEPSGFSAQQRYSERALRGTPGARRAPGGPAQGYRENIAAAPWADSDSDSDSVTRARPDIQWHAGSLVHDQ